jgi:hypothetical protein
VKNLDKIKSTAKKESHPGWFCGEKGCEICHRAWASFERILKGDDELLNKLADKTKARWEIADNAGEGE